VAKKSNQKKATPGSAPFGYVSPVGIFGRHMDVPSENPCPIADPEGARCPRRVSFGYLFFARAKKRFSTAEWLVKVTPAAGA
jgi:hypothetical protein